MLKRILLFSFSLLLPSRGISEDAASSVPLVRDKVPASEIVLSEKPTRSAQFAAFELQHHIRRITGAELSIVPENKHNKEKFGLFLGETRFAREHGVWHFPEQTHTIRVLRNGMILAGCDDPDYGKAEYNMSELLKSGGFPSCWKAHGTTDAVYDFLENDLGVCWFDQSEFGTVLPPRTDTLSPRVKDRTRTPFMKYRGVAYAPLRLERHSCYWPLNSKEMKAFLVAAYPETAWKYPPATSAFFHARAKLGELYLLRSGNGGENLHCNHSFYGYYDRFWAKNPKNPKVFEGKRPEFFARIPTSSRDQKPPQMCYSSDALLKQVVSDAALYFKGTPPYGLHPWQWGKDFFAVVPMDNSNFCECEKCLAFAKKNPDTKMIFDFANRVARELRKTHPDKFVSILAYSSYLPPPTYPLEDNISVHFCFDASHAPFGSPRQKQQLEYLRGWREKLGKKTPLYMWFYGWGPRLGASYGNYNCFPGVYARETDALYKIVGKYNVRGVFYDGFTTGPDGWLVFKLMRNPFLDTSTLLDEYFTKMYGKAREPMRALYERMEQIFHNPSNWPKGKDYSLSLSWENLGTVERMKELQTLLDHAKKLADTRESRQRITLFEKGIWSYMLAGRKLYEEKNAYPISVFRVRKTQKAFGDPDKADWTRAIDGGPFYKTSSKTLSARELGLKMTHDGEFFYLELNDPCNTSLLESNPAVFAFDTWEVLLAKQRGQPFRQYAANFKEQMLLHAWWEINMTRYTRIPVQNTTKIRSLVTKDNWRFRFAFKLDNMIDVPIRPGDSIFMNVLRCTNPRMAGLKTATGQVDSWNSYSKVNDPDRFAEVILEKDREQGK